MATTTQARGRRVPRPTGDDRERAILATAERLLEERSLSEISVDDLARGAGISRPTFYFYFESKDAVLLTLLDRMIEEAHAIRGDALERLAEDPRRRLGQIIGAFHETLRHHRAAALAASEARLTNLEVRRLWSQVMEGWVQDAVAAIEFERARGAAPADVPARDLAIALIQMNERVMHASLAREEPSVPAASLVDVLVSVWLSAIYGAGATLTGKV